MKVIVDPSLQSLSGRWSRKDTTVISLNKKTGKMHQWVYTEHEDKNTTDQQAVRATFKQRSAAAASWWNSNKPSTTNPDGTADYQTLKRLYDNQYKYGNPYLFLRSRVQADLSIDLGASSSSSSGSGSGGNSDEM